MLGLALHAAAADDCTDDAAINASACGTAAVVELSNPFGKSFPAWASANERGCIFGKADAGRLGARRGSSDAEAAVAARRRAKDRMAWEQDVRELEKNTGKPGEPAAISISDVHHLTWTRVAQNTMCSTPWYLHVALALGIAGLPSSSVPHAGLLGWRSISLCAGAPAGPGRPGLPLAAPAGKYEIIYCLFRGFAGSPARLCNQTGMLADSLSVEISLDSPAVSDYPYFVMHPPSASPRHMLHPTPMINIRTLECSGSDNAYDRSSVPLDDQTRR